MAVASAIGDWEKRDESTRFQHWLSRVTKNAVLNSLLRRPRDQAVGGSSAEGILSAAVDRDGATTALIETELRRELYLRATEMVKVEFREDSWRAFELSVTGDLTIEEVAVRLSKTVVLEKSSDVRDRGGHVS